MTLTPSQLELAKKAHTLKEWYAAHGQVLPDVASRVGLYHMLGLGAPSTYAASAEQNNRMLVALKRQEGLL